jgi:hypothetical protein
LKIIKLSGKTLAYTSGPKASHKMFILLDRYLRADPSKNEPQQQGISYLERERDGVRETEG